MTDSNSKEPGAPKGPLHDEVHAELERLSRPELPLEELADPADIEEVPFNPVNTTDYPDDFVVVGGRRWEIHDVSNVPWKIALYLARKQGKEPQDFLSQAVIKAIADNEAEIDRMMARFAELYPKLHAWVVKEGEARLARDAAQAQKGHADLTRLLESMPEQEESGWIKVHSSMFWDGIKPIADAVAPDFDATFFWR